MVERTRRGYFGGLMVFPGGAVEGVDYSEAARSVMTGPHEDAAHRAAALRELAEEVGIALTTRGPVPAPDLRGPELFAALGGDGVVLDGGGLILISRWVTPEYAPRRYDAHFYLAGLGGDVHIRLDTTELVGHTWTRPDAALERLHSGEWQMFTPTIHHLRWLVHRTSVEDAVDSARGADGRTLIRPMRLEDGSIVPIAVPADDA